MVSLSRKSEWNSAAIARKWKALAERRRNYLVELYQTGRWRRYYSEATFLVAMRAVKADIEAWGKLAEDEAAPPDRLRKTG